MVNRLVGQYHRRHSLLKSLQSDAEAILVQEHEWGNLTDADLQRRFLELREQFCRGGKKVAGVLLPALAGIREAATRQLGLRPFPVQLMGALALHRGYLAEMATGEGKTLTAGLAGVLAGWSKRPCHVVTVNDYLVQRDAEWLSPFYHFCGVRVGQVLAIHAAPERIKGYGCDVTYVTSKELLADFLRDRLRLGRLENPSRRLIRLLLQPKLMAESGLVLRGLHTAIVDEADSVLIDEAVTPLIISSPHKNESLSQAAQMAQHIIQELQLETDYRSDLRYKEIELTKGGLEKLIEKSTHLPGLWRGQDRRLELVIQALVAREFFHRDQQYIIDGNKVVIVDEFTGRPMPQRTWREGMHQAIEAKEGLPISDPAETIARLSFQRFFRCFHRLSGMSGTAREAAREVWQIYGLPVMGIPPNKPCIRTQWPDQFFLTEEAKWQAIADEVKRVSATGRPILIGTRSVQTSERLWRLLAPMGLDVKILNATRLKEEAATIALAGECGRITIATNLAGRGTDIKLGRDVATLGGLHVIASEWHESARVDRQLFGRSGRQGDPGSAQAFASLEDELLRKYVGKVARHLVAKAMHRELPGQQKAVQATFKHAQAKAQKSALKQRQNILRSDLWLEQALSFTGADTV